MRRRAFLENLAAAGVCGVLPKGLARAKIGPYPNDLSGRVELKAGLDWVERMNLGRRHLVHGVDRTGLPYFDVLLKRPYAEAGHDFPDFIDILGRYWEASLLVPEMTGKPVDTEPLMRKRIFAALASEPDGLPYYPSTPLSSHMVEMWGLSRVLFCLVRLAQLDPTLENRVALQHLTRALKSRVPQQGKTAWIPSMVWDRNGWRDPSPGPKGVPFGALVLIRPLTEASTVLKDDEPLDLAWRLINSLKLSGEFSPDGKWFGHSHAHLTAIAGIAECGRLKSDKSMIDWARRAFAYAQSFSTDFGWVPENIYRHDDCVGCETCAIMDYLDSALQLARSGDSELWNLVERTTRNHLIESQVVNSDWLKEPPHAYDTEFVIQRGMGKRMIGAFGGWSSPIGILTYDEYYTPFRWYKTGPPLAKYLLGGRIRALQNCCAGSGLKALWRVWRQTSRVENGTLVVEMPLDRNLPEAIVTSRQPFGDYVSVRVKTPLRLKVRQPGDIKVGSVVARKNGSVVPLTLTRGYFNFDELKPDDHFEISFDRPRHSQQVSIGNPGYEHYAFDVQWRGATVVKIEPSPTNPTKGFDRYDNAETALHVKGKVEHPLYLRESWDS